MPGTMMCSLLLILYVINTATVTAEPVTTLLDLPPRYMWGWGPGVSGYCGSATLQTMGLFFGNFWTEDAIRGTSGGHNAKHELLLDYPTELAVPSSSMLHACGALRLNCSMFDHRREPKPQVPTQP